MLNRRKKTENDAPASHGSTALGAGNTRAAQPAPRDRSQGKTGPTPRRRDQEAARRRTLVPEDRKAARKAERDAATAERMRQRQALETGDERNLPARDKGPQKRYVRDYIDARTGLGEWLMPIVLVYVIAMFIPGTRAQVILMVTLYVIVGLVIAESFYISAQIKKRLTATFGTPEPGSRFYGVMRALQFRRLRLPTPQVRRGEFPA